MKLTLTTTLSILSTLASCLALPDLSRRETVIHPSIGVVIRDRPGPPLPPNIVEVSCGVGAPTVRALLGFVVPACNGTCTIGFTDDILAAGSRGLQLLTMLGYPSIWNTWDARPPLNVHIGTFRASAGAGPATVVQDFGLTFPCRAATTRLGFEVNEVRDNDNIIWDITRGGFVITCS